VKPAATLLLLALAAPARAALAVPASVEELARASEAVVRGKVASARAHWSSDGLRIFTTVEVEVAATWRGAAPARVQVRVPGGVVGDLGQRVDGMATFAEGEEVVVFLARPGAAGPYQVAGVAQGKFVVAAGQARPDLSHTAFVEAPLRPGERRAGPMDVAELERRVRVAR
jgi:hypothetical protein